MRRSAASRTDAFGDQRRDVPRVEDTGKERPQREAGCGGATRGFRAVEEISALPARDTVGGPQRSGFSSARAEARVASPRPSLFLAPNPGRA